MPFPVDHIIARQHGGEDASDNLALSCLHCNLHKGPNLAGTNPENGEVVRLFHPRKDEWAEHFVWYGPIVTGQTLVGYVTIQVLAMNAADVVALREELIAEGVFALG